MIPGLTKAYDEESGSIKLTREEIDKLLESTEKQIKQQAYTEVLESAYKAQAEAALEATKAEEAYKAATDDLSTALGGMSVDDFLLLNPQQADRRTCSSSLTDPAGS